MNIIEERTEGKSCFQAGASSIIGGRNYQQDFGYLYIGEQDAAAVVCDGMGGMEGGELASRTAVELFQSDFHKEKAGPVFDIPSFLWKEANKMAIRIPCPRQPVAY